MQGEQADASASKQVLQGEQAAARG